MKSESANNMAANEFAGGNSRRVWQCYCFDDSQRCGSIMRFTQMDARPPQQLLRRVAGFIFVYFALFAVR